MTIQRRFASVVATACILVLAACGGGEPGSQPGVPVTPASHGGTRLTPASRTAGRGAAAAAGRATSLARVYIANDAKNSITAYRPNHTKLLTKITSGVDVPLSVVLDAAGNVYVANENAATVTVCAPGSNRAANDRDRPAYVSPCTGVRCGRRPVMLPMPRIARSRSTRRVAAPS